jgi:hypothetical protein
MNAIAVKAKPAPSGIEVLIKKEFRAGVLGSDRKRFFFSFFSR